MTRKELQEVRKDYSRQIKAVLESRQDMTSWIAAFCLGLADEMCYNHHERGQRLWAFSQALKEAEEARCPECGERESCPAYGTGVLYPCPYYEDVTQKRSPELLAAGENCVTEDEA